MESRRTIMNNAFIIKQITAEISVLTFDLPDEKVNIFNTAVMTELDEKIDQLSRQTDIKCLLIRSAKEDRFIAGADIREILTITSVEKGYEASRRGQEIFAKLSAAAFSHHCGHRWCMPGRRYGICAGLYLSSGLGQSKN